MSIEMAEAAAKAWNRLRFLVDDHRTGHVYTPVQEIPDLNMYLSSYASEFRRAPVPLVNVRTYSHIFSPFIWRVIKYYKALHPAEAAAIPEIPDEWLTYGHDASRRNNLSSTTFRNSRQANDPHFFGVGHQAQQTFWDQKIAEAAENPDFVRVLFQSINLPVQQAQQAPAQGARRQENINRNLARAIEESLGVQQSQSSNSRIDVLRKMLTDNGIPLNRFTDEQLRKAINSAGAINSAFNALVFSGGKHRKTKRRQTKRKTRKEKRTRKH